MIESPVSTPLSGSLRFLRYAFMPNRLRYCGGDDNRTLFEYGIESAVDGGLTPLLKRFNGALPYLQLIARANGIPDPFDARVVEAYWIGSPLLDTVEVRQLYDHLLDRFGKQLHGRNAPARPGQSPAGARPHHSFHVLDVHSRVGELENSMHTLDSCRVSWGKVVAVDGAELLVDRQPLQLELGKLVLGAPQRTRVVRQVSGRRFADAVQVDDWVSLHWGWVCEVLTAQQQDNVARYTHYHFDACQSNALITTRRLRRLPGMCLHVSDDPLGDDFAHSLVCRPGFVVRGLPPALVGNLAENGRSVRRARLQSSDHRCETVAAVLRYGRGPLGGFFRSPLEGLIAQRAVGYLACTLSPERHRLRDVGQRFDRRPFALAGRLVHGRLIEGLDGCDELGHLSLDALCRCLTR